MKLKRTLSRAMGAALIAIAMTGCKAPQDVAYFQDIADIQTVMTTAPQTIKAEPHDQLMIVVSSKDQSLANLFNLHVYAKRLGQETTREEMCIYTISEKGTIDFPVLGELKVGGMTREEIAGFIKGELMGRELVKDPVVTVQMMSSGISVLGEVNHPGRISIPKDQLTLIEGLALAGDLGLQGERRNILVMRRNGDKMESYRVDITNGKELMSSPVYYLKQGDVIYVEPNNQLKRQTKINGNNVLSASFWVSIASLLATVAVLFTK